MENIVRGSIRELPRGPAAMHFEWKIPDFLSLPEKKDYHIDSPIFQFTGVEWRLRVYPNGENGVDKDGYMHLEVEMLSSAVSTHDAIASLGISDHEGNMSHVEFTEIQSKIGGYMWVIADLIEISELRNKKSLNGAVTFFCHLQVKSGETSDACTQTRWLDDWDELNKDKQEFHNDDKRTGAQEVTKHLMDLLLSEEEWDVILKVKNQEFKAHKTILVARSSVFKAMFQHEMTENLSRQVDITDSEPDAFKIFLLYLYTGYAEGLSNSNVFHVCTVANKYDATQLMARCMEYMLDNLSIESVCDVIEFALLHEKRNLLEKATVFCLKHFKDIVLTAKWQRFLHENTTAANELLIKAMQYYVPPE